MRHRGSLGSPSNTGDKLRSSIACAGFVCFIPLFGGLVALPALYACLAKLNPSTSVAMVTPRLNRAYQMKARPWSAKPPS